MRVLLLPLLCAAALLTGCNLVNVKIEDDGTGFTEGEVVYTRHRQNEEPLHRYETISASYSHSQGQSTQTLTGNEYVNISGRQISAPATLNNEVDLGVGYLQWLWHTRRQEKLEDYLGVGLAYADFQYKGFYEGLSGTQSFRIAQRSLGLTSKLGFTYHFTPIYALDGNLGLYVFMQDDEAYLVTTDLRLLASPSDTIQLFAGYRRWAYTLVEPEQSQSSIEAVLSGPMVGLILRF